MGLGWDRRGKRRRGGRKRDGRVKAREICNSSQEEGGE